MAWTRLSNSLLLIPEDTSVTGQDKFNTQIVDFVEADQILFQWIPVLNGERYVRSYVEQDMVTTYEYPLGGLVKTDVTWSVPWCFNTFEQVVPGGYRIAIPCHRYVQ